MHIYIASSFKHKHGVRLLSDKLRSLGCNIFDWTEKASPPPGLTSAERRIWMDTDINGGQVYEFCHKACVNSDLVIYYGASGQDAGVEIGLAKASNVPILGIRGPLESAGLMLHGSVLVWVDEIDDALQIIESVIRHAKENWVNLKEEQNKSVLLLSQMFKDKKLIINC